MEYDDRVMCPLIDEKIDPMECVDVVDCVLNPLFLNSRPKPHRKRQEPPGYPAQRHFQT